MLLPEKRLPAKGSSSIETRQQRSAAKAVSKPGDDDHVNKQRDSLSNSKYRLSSVNSAKSVNSINSVKSIKSFKSAKSVNSVKSNLEYDDNDSVEGSIYGETKDPFGYAVPYNVEDINTLRNTFKRGSSELISELLSSKSDTEGRQLAMEVLHEHVEAFNSIASAYLQVVAALQSSSNIIRAVKLEIREAIKDGNERIRVALRDNLRGVNNKLTFADAARNPVAASGEIGKRIQVGGGKTKPIPKVKNIYIGPIDGCSKTFKDSEET